jgi:hypothetical protein
LSGNFNNFNGTLIGKKYVIEQKLLHNLLKSDSWRENFVKFYEYITEKMYKLRYISSKVSEKWYVGIFFPQRANDFGKRNINSRLKCPSAKTSARPFRLGKTSPPPPPPPSRNTEVTALPVSVCF